MNTLIRIIGTFSRIPYTDPAFDHVFTVTMITAGVAGIGLSIFAGFFINELLSTDIFGIFLYKVAAFFGLVEDDSAEV